MSIIRVNGHSFFRRFISHTSVIVDLGANQGGFSQQMVEAFGCHCYAVEAHVVLFENLPRNERIDKYNFAITKQSGVVEFYVSDNSESSSLFASGTSTIQKTVSVPAKTLSEFVEEQNIPSIDLLKMDIEGAELDVVDSCTDDFLQRISQITVEFHDFNDLLSYEDVTRIIQRLKKLGFLCVIMSRPQHGHEDVCFINQHRCPISKVEFLWVSYVLRNFYRIKRVLSRAIATR